MGAFVVLIVSMVAYALEHPRTAMAPALPEVATTTPSPSQDVSTETTGVFTLGLGETGTSHGWTITPTSLVQDSRCPVDVQCIQAGTVEVNVRIGSSSVEKTITLVTPEEIEGGQITLVQVTPDKNSKFPTKQQEYRFSFLVVTR